jgi:hypothetical protein
VRYVHYYPSLMTKPVTTPELDALQQTYKDKIDQLFTAIRAEEAFATHDYSEAMMEKWDSAHFAVLDAVAQIKAARVAYKEGLRKLHYGI